MLGKNLNKLKVVTGFSPSSFLKVSALFNLPFAISNINYGILIHNPDSLHETLHDNLPEYIETKDSKGKKVIFHLKFVAQSKITINRISRKAYNIVTELKSTVIEYRNMSPLSTQILLYFPLMFWATIWVTQRKPIDYRIKFSRNPLQSLLWRAPHRVDYIGKGPSITFGSLAKVEASN